MTTLTDPLSLAFLAWCETERTPLNTTRRRRSTLTLVATAGTITREGLEEWWTSRTGKAPSTRATDLANLRTFYRWCRLWEHREDDPSRRLRAPKVSKGLPRMTTDDDFYRLLRHYASRDPAMFRAFVLGSQAGLRVAEAAALLWGDVDQAHRHLTIRGKGGKVRRVPLEPPDLAALGAAGASTESVVTGTAEVYTADQLQHRANRAIRRAGVAATFHQLRHRYGTLAYQESKDLVAVGKLMGHASLNTTAVYAAAADETARKMAAAMALDPSRWTT